MPTGKCMNKEQHEVVGFEPVRFEWKGVPQLKEAACFMCGRPLQRTTTELKGVRVLEGKPPIKMDV